MKFYKNYMIKKLKAAVVLEVLLGLLIIMICFVIGIMIYTRVLAADNLVQKLKADFILSESAIKIKESKQFIDSEEKQEPFTIKKTFTKYAGTKNLYRMYLNASIQNKIVSERNELVIDDGLEQLNQTAVND